MTCMASATDARIPVSNDVRRELRMLKTREDLRSYDTLLRSILEEWVNLVAYT